jgi:hypothetical protein
MKNIFDKITMPVGVVYNIVAENGCKMQGKANVEQVIESQKDENHKNSNVSLSN